MAIHKIIEVKGFPVSYWHISSLRYLRFDDSTIVTIRGFKDLPTRQASIHNFVHERAFVMSGEQSRAMVYQFMMVEDQDLHDGEEM